MKFVPNAVSARVGRQILLTQKHSPTILFVGGVAGFVATTVLAAKATLKVEDVLVDAQKKLQDVESVQHVDYSDTDRKHDKAVLYTQTVLKLGKLYGPTIIVGGLSIAALTGSHNILTKRNAAVTAAYAALEKGFNQYRERVVAELGEDKDREFKYGVKTREIVEETKQGPKVSEIKEPKGTSVYARFFDETSTSWSPQASYNQIFLRAQQSYFNDMLKARGHVFLNEVYDALGLERSKEGAVVGWLLGKGGDDYVDFGIFDGDNFANRMFVNHGERSILLDFNVDGLIYDKI